MSKYHFSLCFTTANAVSIDGIGWTVLMGLKEVVDQRSMFSSESSHYENHFFDEAVWLEDTIFVQMQFHMIRESMSVSRVPCQARLRHTCSRNKVVIPKNSNLKLPNLFLTLRTFFPLVCKTPTLLRSLLASTRITDWFRNVVGCIRKCGLWEKIFLSID